MSQTAIGIQEPKYHTGATRVDMKLEVALIPVSDVDRAKEFYTRLGWRLDADDVMGNDFRIVQLTPPGSGCSVSFGKGVTSAAPGSIRGALIVSDIEAAHKELVARGIKPSEVFHGSPFSRISGPDPERQSYNSYVSFEDPDGNMWIVQEVTRRLPGRMDPRRQSLHQQTTCQTRCAERQPHTVNASTTGSKTPTGRTGTQRTWWRSRQGRNCRSERRSAGNKQRDRNNHSGENNVHEERNESFTNVSS
jgi:catechol 2,3-dioxygenase-like lactoylglutathione lyase family enzyme